MSIRIGIDLGGTKIEIIALDETGKELLRRRVPTPISDYTKTIGQIVQLVETAEAELGHKGTVGVGMPGALSAVSGRIKNANSGWLNDRPLLHDLQIALHRDVKLANDANCFALSEAVDGAGQGDNVVFGVILGTGVGGGIVAHHHLIAGVNAIAGEWGHNPLPFMGDADMPAPQCYCGKSACIETYLSGPSMSRDHLAATSQRLSAEEIVRHAAAGDQDCDTTLHRYEHRLARALAHVINLLDPDIIVLGGGLSNIDRLYTNVPQLWGPYIFSDYVATRLSKNHHGDSSGVRGAAWLWN